MNREDPPAIFCTRTHRVIDVCGADDQEAHRQGHLAEYGPDLVILPFSEAWQRHEDANKTEPEEISEAAWHEALNVLPPVCWRNDGNGESFKLGEPLTGAITAIYVRVGDRHFTFNDDVRTPHNECLRRVARSKAWRDRQEPHTDVTSTASPANTPSWSEEDRNR